MIRVYDSNEKVFNNNGIKILHPLFAEITKTDNGDYCIELEDILENIDYYQKGMIIRVSTPWGVQGFRCNNPEIKNNRIISKAWHLTYDSKNYIITDKSAVNKNCNAALDYYNSNADIETPFTTISDISTVLTTRMVRKTLYDVFVSLIDSDKYGGHLYRDNFTFGIKQNIGEDRGVVLSNNKNITDISTSENWDSVCTKILPYTTDGENAILLDDVYVELNEQLYDIPYTRIVKFENIYNSDDFETYEAFLNATKLWLSQTANEYLQENKVPKINYSVSAKIDNISDIGDTIYVKHSKCKVNITTQVISIVWDAISGKYKKIEFGNFKKELKNLTQEIVSQATKQSESLVKENKIILENELAQATAAINNVLGNSYVIYDGDKILVVDSLPKEEATHVIKISSGGIGFSEHGINGPFNSAWLIDGTLDMQQINVINLTASLIRGGVLKLGGANDTNGILEVYDENGNVIGSIDKDGINFNIINEIKDKTSQLQLQSDEISQRIEDGQYYIDENGNKQTISSSINELKNTAEELNLNLQKIGGLNLMKNSSGQNGTIGYKGKMLKPYIEFQTWNEFNQYISTLNVVNEVYTCFIHVVGEPNDSDKDCWYGLYYRDGYSRKYYYEQVVLNGNYMYPDRYNFYMDFMYDELYTFVEANYTDTESFKKFLIDYTNDYTNISANIFSSMTNDFIENNTIAKSAFLLIPTVRDAYTAIDEDYIYGESFTVPNNVRKLYFSAKSKIDGLCGKARLILYQLDDKMDNIQNNLNVYDSWSNHVISETIISIPDNLLNSDSFEEYKREVNILDNTVDILPCFSIGNNFVNDGAYANFKNPILNPINRFYWKKVWETIDNVSAYYTYRSIHTKKKLQFFESSTIPEISNTPDFTQLWLCTEDIDTYIKDKLYTPQYELDNNGTILSKTWITTEYTKEQIENNIEIIMFDGWTYVYSAMGDMDATPRPDMKFLIADCMVSTTDTSWQPASGENYWGKNIKISGDKGIYIYNTVDGYNRIIDEKQDIATDNSGNTLWQLTGKGMKTKRAECESIRLPKLEILCTSDSTAFYYKENEDDDYGA